MTKGPPQGQRLGPHPPVPTATPPLLSPPLDPGSILLSPAQHPGSWHGPAGVSPTTPGLPKRNSAVIPPPDSTHKVRDRPPYAHFPTPLAS